MILLGLEKLGQHSLWGSLSTKPNNLDHFFFINILFFGVNKFLTHFQPFFLVPPKKSGEVQTNLSPKLFLCQTKSLVQTKFGSQQIWVPKKFDSKIMWVKKCDPKIIWVKKNVGPKKNFIPKKCGSPKKR